MQACLGGVDVYILWLYEIPSVAVFWEAHSLCVSQLRVC